ncbi:phosphoglycerate mutase-like protein [Martensiomyces pterosporus]|nr:phosphoglycerate mutase-like protein [Martensiomyces pterosporus]
MHILSLSPVVLAAAYAASVAAAPASASVSASASASQTSVTASAAAATSAPAPVSGSSVTGTTYDTGVSKYTFDDASYNYCQAAVPSCQTYKAVPNAKLEFVQLVVRHGDRTTEHVIPNEDTTWTCDGVEEDIYLHGTKQPKQNTTGTVKQVIEIPAWNKKTGFSNQIWKGSCESGQLTDRGKAQHHYLGTQLREIYVNRLKYLPSKLADPESVYVRSTYVWRTKNSAESLLGGLWPDRGHDSTDAITLHTYPQSIETMFDNAGACPKITDLSNKITGSDQFQQFLKEENALMAKLNSNFGVSGSSWNGSWTGQLDVLMPRHCYGMKLPCNATANNCPTDADVAQTMRNANFQYAFKYRDHPLAPKFTRLAIGSFLATLRDQVQDRIAGKIDKLKIAIYSGHDSTVAPILGVLKASNKDMLWPPYASSLAFELWKKTDGSRVIRAIYNGHTLQLQKGAEWCDLESCPVEKFAKYLEDYIPQDIAAECSAK